MRDRLLVLEATLLVAGIWASLRMLRYPPVRRLVDVYGDRRTVVRSSTPQRIAWAITSVAARLPVHTTCLMRALAGHAMTRRRGWPSEIRIGVRPRGSSQSRPLDSHAWMEVDGQVLIGDLENLADYGVLTRRTAVP
jgi:hypothetical protein